VDDVKFAAVHSIALLTLLTLTCFVLHSNDIDKLITYIVCLYKNLYQVLPVV
jgi:hypothetical protein